MVLCVSDPPCFLSPKLFAVLKPVLSAGLMNRNAMLQQLNKNQLPQPLTGRATPPPAGALPFGMSEPRLSGGIDAFGNVAPKPQPSPQQVGDVVSVDHEFARVY